MENKGAVLITGAAGFLGSCLLAECKSAGFSVFGLDKRRPSESGLWAQFAVGACEEILFENLFASADIKAIFHLAGGASVSFSTMDPFGDFTTLLPGTVRVSQFARTRKAKLIFFSSAAVYGNPPLLPVRENSIAQPISPYGVHKYLAEVLLKEYSRLWDLSVTVLRPFSAYGPGLRKQVLWDVGRRALSASYEAKSISLFGTGNETRDFIYGSDLARAALHVMRSQTAEPFEVFNVGTGIESSISEVVSLLLQELDISLEIKFDGNARAGDPIAWSADISKLENLGFKPQVNLREGVRRVAEWLRSLQWEAYENHDALHALVRYGSHRV
jgi:UDP-glucose 4-epimerase